ncbi:diguanylate cyclase [uncultured Paraglaciecola sp.]|uniref:sensor domain-containing diguanylate cyclase n=1 Tax=uncultured Paraglaciecola sp. TaxID=1765024 RepID=UPI0026217998|nr:diguanylate cyclase [uncultured Paraglaciecola sp.]
MMPNSQFNLFTKKDWLLFSIIVFSIIAIFTTTNFSTDILPSHTEVQDVEYLVDSKKRHSIASILINTTDTWQQRTQTQTSIGTSNQKHWFRFTLNDINQAKPMLLVINNALLDNISLWFIHNKKIIQEYHLGDSLKFSQRVIEHENFLIPVPLHQQQIQVYISTHSKGAQRLPINVWQQKDYLEYSSKSVLIMGGFFGLMLAMGLSNLFFYITTRASTFLVYAGYVLFLTLTLAALQGLGYRYLWPNSPWLQQHAVGIFVNLAFCMSILFCNLLLNIKAHSKRLNKLLNANSALFLFGFVASFIIPLQTIIKPFFVVVLTSGIIILSVSIWLWFKGQIIARYYTIAWIVLFVSGFTVSLDTLDVINVNFPSFYLFMLGAVIETVLLALILAINHNQQRRALLSTQEALIDKERQTQQAQRDLLVTQENATEELEYKVQERTLELEIALRELSETNQELQEKNTLDALTGIRNRSFFDKKHLAEVRRSRREQSQLSIVMIDIDHFKKVNDQYGHLVGDECIKTVAKILQSALKRPSDVACRYGGEEFALILPSTDLVGAQILVEQLRAEIENTSIQAEEVSINITISAGIGTATLSFEQPEDSILSLADKQLYAAKNAGRNNVQSSSLDVFKQQD